MENTTLFSEKAIIGVIHLLPLPGAPKYAGSIQQIIDRALKEANLYQAAQVDGIIIENFNDEPFSVRDVGKDQLAMMASITGQVRREITLPIGINVHFNDWEAEMAIGFACQAQFVRVEVFVDTVVTTSGIVEPCCAEVTRYRKMLGAEQSVQVFADVHPKYSRNLLETPLEVSARMAEDSLADAIIVTGYTTGEETPIDDVRKVKAVTRLPVVVGSGTNIHNVREILEVADGAIVGSAFKHDGDVHNELSEQRLRAFMQVVRG